MNDFDFLKFLRGFMHGETKEGIIQNYLNGVYTKDEYIKRMKEWEDRNADK